MSDIPKRFSYDKILKLATSAVRKIDLQGPRGTTLCSMDEIDAMACLIASSGLSPTPGKARGDNETPIFKTRRIAT